TVNLLPRGWGEGCSDDSFTPRTAFFIAHVRTALRPAFRSLSPGRARLSRLRTQRLAGPKEFRIHVRSLRGDHEPFHRSHRALALHTLYAGLWRARGFSYGAGSSRSHRGSHRSG